MTCFVLHVRIEYKCPTAYVQLDAMTTAGLELVSDARGREREKERREKERGRGEGELGRKS